MVNSRAGTEEEEPPEDARDDLAGTEADEAGARCRPLIGRLARRADRRGSGRIGFGFVAVIARGALG